ncbi:MAG: ribose-phosphate pyrophosphokinase [Ignavibacteriales bacterium CG07_land_8_20_14_0_80_59_12]|nr:MAG: ribose-phosphate pyrophosphokinase [Ignavibacteriales bacterium CG07_land_8_20_14_0_80_59_12]
MNGLRVFSGRANLPLAQGIAKAIGEPLGSVEIRNFNDGEIWVKYGENIRGGDVFIIQPTVPPAENLLELLILIDAAKRASASRVTAVITYFGYARQDRKDQPRVALTAKLVANLLTKAGADRIITMDLHAAQIQGFFDIPFDHLYSSPIIVRYFAKQHIPNLTVVAPDVGGVRMARAYAKRLGADLILIDKRRPQPNVAEIMNIVGNAQGRNIVIVDDLIDTAGTFTNAVKALKEAGAVHVYGACTHAIFSGQAVERIEGSEVEKIIVTDSVLQRRASPKIQVLSVAELFAEAITRTNKNESISSLFDIEKN